MFAEERELGVGLLLPDLTHLEEGHLKIEGIVLTMHMKTISARSHICCGAFLPRFMELK